MDTSELAAKMLEWEKGKKALDALEDEIKSAVMELGKTQNVGNVRATYSGGRKSYDYTAAWERGGYGTGVDIEQYKKVSVSYDYRGACKDANIEEIPFTQSDPSVTVKII